MKTETALRLEYLNREAPLVPGEDYKIRFKIVDKTGKRPNLVLNDIGSWFSFRRESGQQRQVARPAGDGVYEVTVNVPETGVYLVFIESRSRRFSTANCLI